jgi:hypothetical protein
MMSATRKPKPNGRSGTGAGIRRAEPPRTPPSRRWTIIGLGLAVLAAVVAGAVWQFAGGDSSSEARPAVVTDRLARTVLDPVSEPTWPPNYSNLSQVNKALGLPGLSETVLHIHAHLDLWAGGNKVVVPADLAYNPSLQAVSPIHTHDETGVIHVEADDPKFKATLQDLFDVWGVMLTPDRLGGYKGVHLWVNGKPVSGDPGAYEMKAHDEIALVAGDVPSGFQPPTSYKFPPGE